jgi:hypothetical protein
MSTEEDLDLYHDMDDEGAEDEPRSTRTTVPAIHPWKSNAELIAAAAELGYLRKEWRTLDPTYGRGVFWKVWRPEKLVKTDIDPTKSPNKKAGVDFTKMPWKDESFQAVVFDPPYKLTGTSQTASDARYGVKGGEKVAAILLLMTDGLEECARVVAKKGYVLAKCQPQVVSGHVVWQDLIMIEAGKKAGLELVDRLDMIGTSRKQPMEGRKQKHAHGRASTLLVFRKP